MCLTRLRQTEVLKDTKEEVYNKLLTYKLIAYSSQASSWYQFTGASNLARVLPTAFCLNVCILEDIKGAFCF